MQKFDILVIGGGPAGYVLAIRASQLGFHVACIEDWRNEDGKPALGGTCLNVGCIPSKALLDSSERYEETKTSLAEHGIHAENVTLDLAAMLARKVKVVRGLTDGIAGLFKKNKVSWLQGRASLRPDHQVEVLFQDGAKETFQAQHIVIATGSVPNHLPVAPFDGHRIVDSTGALSFEYVPETLGVIGAGVIGLELGSVWRRLGSKVTLIEALPEFLPTADRDVAKEAEKLFRQQGLAMLFGAKLVKAEVLNDAVKVTYVQNSQEASQLFDRLIVAVGRRPNTMNLGLEEVGVEVNDKGFIKVDAHFRTSVEGIYAIGDVIGGPMLAHKASEEGVALAELLAGQKPEVRYDVIPWVIYTHPEIAWCGNTEIELQNNNIPYKKGIFPFMANGRARAMGESKGFVKILSHEQTDRILGVHIFGPQASELIAEAVVAMEFFASAEDIARIVHAHPTLSESIHEAALATDKRTIHL
jgi:dihydrolipoamide dehydrogenase